MPCDRGVRLLCELPEAPCFLVLTLAVHVAAIDRTISPQAWATPPTLANLFTLIGDGGISGLYNLRDLDHFAHIVAGASSGG